MYSLDEFYSILFENLLKPSGLLTCLFYPYGSTDVNDLVEFNDSRQLQQQQFERQPPFNQILTNILFFYDQEPMLEHSYAEVIDYLFSGYTSKTLRIIATSEISNEISQTLKEYQIREWYYFFHGFAALNWYKIYKWWPSNNVPFTKLFITLNNLITKERSHRLNLVSRLLEANLNDVGLISCPLSDTHGTWRDEIFSVDSSLSTPTKKLIYKHFNQRITGLIVDTSTPHGALSGRADIELQQEALWNIVTETVFYHNKLHLTEKVFKPIVAKRPFFLVAAPGNLRYLKRYGFKTFDRWVDESYDTEPDNDIRIQKIVNELDRMSKMSQHELETMHQEMMDTLEYNFNHFYTNFKEIIVDELVDNFESCVKQHNCGIIDVDRIVDISNIDFAAVKKRMLL